MKEYKIMKIKKEKSFDNMEKLMNDMGVFGWEVVSVILDAYSELTPHFIITFMRDDAY